MSTWLVPREELTAEQLRMVELDERTPRLIVGGPGSGKTMVLLHRARYLADEGGFSPDKFQIFVFTKTLRAYIRSALELLNLPLDCVTTFDSWCYSFFKEKIKGKIPYASGTRKPDFEALRQAVLKQIKSNTAYRNMYAFVMVDEGQDLDGTSFEILTLIAKHITVCVDRKQQLYEKGSSELDIASHLGLRRSNVNLLETFRCSPYIVHLAAQFVNDPEEKANYIRQTRTFQTDILTPLVYLANDFEDEKANLIEIVRTCQLKGETIAVLLPQQRQVFGFAQGFKEAGIEVEYSEILDFNSDLPKIMTYHGAKGLTFDNILMPRLVKASFRNLTEERIERQIFVGLTRARKWVYLSAVKGSELTQLSDLDFLEKERVITIQTGKAGPEKSSTVHKAEDDDLMDLL